MNHAIVRQGFLSLAGDLLEHGEVAGAKRAFRLIEIDGVKEPMESGDLFGGREHVQEGIGHGIRSQDPGVKNKRDLIRDVCLHRAVFLPNGVCEPHHLLIAFIFLAFGDCSELHVANEIAMPARNQPGGKVFGRFTQFAAIPENPVPPHGLGVRVVRVLLHGSGISAGRVHAKYSVAGTQKIAPSHMCEQVCGSLGILG